MFFFLVQNFTHTTTSPLVWKWKKLKIRIWKNNTMKYNLRIPNMLYIPSCGIGKAMRFFRPGCINNFRINGLRHTALRWKNSQVLILTGDFILSTKWDELTPAYSILIGATASGKSDLALELSRHRDVEIVIADSVQVSWCYLQNASLRKGITFQVIKYLDIGSNKPSQMELDLIPHHLLDIHEPHEFFRLWKSFMCLIPL